jgi:beta-lactam-binding protein with PASTA domain
VTEDSTKREPAAAEPSLDIQSQAGTGTAESVASNDDATIPRSPEAEARRRYRLPVLAAVAVVALLIVVLGTGTWVAEHATTTVPSVTGLRVIDATARLAAAGLTTPTMGAFATKSFQSDVVMEQWPTFETEAPLGTPVDLLVAVAPTPTVVPDVSLETTLAAESTLGYALLRPVVYAQLSGSVPYGRVVAQMPRAGQSIMTGQQVALFVSIGQGTGGAVVPSVLGETLEEAATRITEAYLVPVLLNAHSVEALKGTVADQIPAPGARVPVGSAVPLITTGMGN